MRRRRWAALILVPAALALAVPGGSACSGRSEEPKPAETVSATAPAVPTETPKSQPTPLPTVAADALRVVAVEVATGRVVELPVGLQTLGRRSAWSRDSSYVAVVDQGLAVGTVTSSAFLQFAPDRCFDVEWSPTADVVAAVCAQRLVVFDKDGRLLAEEQVQQTEFTGKQPTVHWAPGGQSLGFGPVSGAVKILANNGVVAEVAGAFTDFQWASDGRLVTFEEPRQQPPSTVRLHDPDRNFAVIAEYTTPARSEGVGVDPTGTYVAYGVYGADEQLPGRILPSTFSVVRIGDSRVVATFEGAYASNYNRASFTPDGGTVAMVFDLCRPETWTLDAGRIDGTRTSLAQGGSMAAKFSPDGQWLGFTRGVELWAVPSDGSAPARRLADEVHGPAGFEWSPDSRWITAVPYFGGFGQCP